MGKATADVLEPNNLQPLGRLTGYVCQHVPGLRYRPQSVFDALALPMPVLTLVMINVCNIVQPCQYRVTRISHVADTLSRC